MDAYHTMTENAGDKVSCQTYLRERNEERALSEPQIATFLLFETSTVIADTWRKEDAGQGVPV